jgi:hypothetical protein
MEAKALKLHIIPILLQDIIDECGHGLWAWGDR